MDKIKLKQLHSDLGDLADYYDQKGVSTSQAVKTLMGIIEEGIKEFPEAQPLGNFQVRAQMGEDALREMGHALKGLVPMSFGFTLLLFEYGEGGNIFYMSTAARKETREMMEEFISKQKEK